MAKFQLVDLGCKKGGATDIMRARVAAEFFKDKRKFKPASCLCVDLQDKYAGVVRNKGYAFSAQNIVTWKDYPPADYYLAVSSLEHMPGIEESNLVLDNMLKAAAKGLWIRVPSFEQDDTGEGQTRKHGLRFAWTHWIGHPSPWGPSHFKMFVAKLYPKLTYRIRHTKIIKDSSHASIVPVESPIDTLKYSAALGPKPRVKFNPPLIGEFDIFIRK